ncbi:MAG: imidazole glycerol phosphate synthase subunit HisH [Woeseiaceae bacterium]|nr:imidazole glycerol phosphate synthase subunit HisH [Woeseiaceae bacterium]
MRPDVAILNSGGANIASLRFALERLGASATLTTEPRLLRSASHVILPGVGAAADAMTRLRATGLAEQIGELTQPVLGICLGLQLFAVRSEENDATCLGLIPGVSRKLTASAKLPVPNMGWCALSKRADHPLLEGIDTGSWFYFVHSYALPVAGYTIATAEHTTAFSAVVARGNVMATQFHPERSARAGATLLANFLRLPG